MKSIKFMVIILMVITMLCSCGTIEMTDTSIDSVASASITSTDSVTSATEAKDLKVPLEVQIADFKNSGYLYDLDLDGIPELLSESWGLAGELYVYKIIDNDLKYIGDIPNTTDTLGWYTVTNLTLYYDETNNEYFLVAEYDMWEKYFYYAEVNKYVFIDDRFVVTNIARCDFNVTEDTIEFTSNKLFGEDTSPIGIVKRIEVTHYYDGVEEYLSQFEKIKIITYDELTAVSVEDAINSGTLSEYLP